MTSFSFTHQLNERLAVDQLSIQPEKKLMSTVPIRGKSIQIATEVGSHDMKVLPSCIY